MKELRDIYRSQSFKGGEFAQGLHRIPSKRTQYEDGAVGKNTCHQVSGPEFSFQSHMTEPLLHTHTRVISILM
jgi:hypothetical protein